MKNNYDVMAEQARQLFLTYDQEKLCQRLSLPCTPEEIPIHFLGSDYHIRRSNGRVLDSAGQQANFNTVMSVYDLLCRGSETPVLKGEFVPVTALNRIHGTHPVHETLNDPNAAFFAGRTAELAELCRRRGGIPWGKGDVSFILPVFDFFPVRLCFWDSDEEFPASLQFFWDANALQFVHYETLWYISGELTRQLKNEIDP